jgi:ADP-L-glycero-D-manno-heptose 6-epimerase
VTDTRTPLDRGTILVTGGAGFIGSALIWALNQRGLDRILVADVLDRSAKWRNLVPLRFDDVVTADHLLASLSGGTLDHIRLVFHLGACSSTTERDADYLFRNNFQYTRTLAEWALARGVRFVYASSAATYGGREGTLSEDTPLADLRPLNPYGYSKHLFDLHAARHGYLDRLVGLKYFNVYGPNEHHKGDMRSMVHKAVEQIQASGQVRLFRSERPAYADGEQRRDFVYVTDAVRMTLHLAEQGAVSGLVNVGTGRSHTWTELAHAVFAAMDRPVRIEFVDLPEALRGTYQYDTRAAVDRLRASGYADPPTPLAEAVADCVRRYVVPDRRLGDDGTAGPAAR